MDRVELHDANVTDVELILGHKDQRFASSIHDSQIASSNIELIGNGRLLMSNSTFDDCEVVGKRASGASLQSASWTNCTFRGKFTDCQFGHDLRRDVKVIIQECDFSDADLHIVSFRGGLDFQSCRFAAWPTVLFESKQLDIPELTKRGLHPRLLSIIKVGSAREEGWLALNVTKYDKSDFDSQERKEDSFAAF